ncbi:MAG: 50S ribosomal protein L27 [Patescibacteria group bacterium]
MAHKKAGGSTTLGRDSRPKYLGVKLHDGEFAKVGSIIIRQRGTKWHPGKNVKLGKDDTIFSLILGVVKFTKKTLKKYDGSLKKATVVNVVATK